MRLGVCSDQPDLAGQHDALTRAVMAGEHRGKISPRRIAHTCTLFRQHPAYRIRHPRVDALCRNGNPFTVRQPLPDGLYRVYGLEGEFLCLSRLEGGVMTSLKNFFGA